MRSFSVDGLLDCDYLYHSIVLYPFERTMKHRYWRSRISLWWRGHSNVCSFAFIDYSIADHCLLAHVLFTFSSRKQYFVSFLYCIPSSSRSNIYGDSESIRFLLTVFVTLIYECQSKTLTLDCQVSFYRYGYVSFVYVGIWLDQMSKIIKSTVDRSIIAALNQSIIQLFISMYYAVDLFKSW